MIFVTVGTQLAFDRLIVAVDEWAGQATNRAAGQATTRNVFAQIGPSKLHPRHVEYGRFISPRECADRMLAADAVIAHAGMGTILTALEMGKPLVVMPRLAKLGEHRNDHQLATATRLSRLSGVMVARNETELPYKLDQLARISAQPAISRYAPEAFVAALRAVIVGRSSEAVGHDAPRTLV